MAHEDFVGFLMKPIRRSSRDPVQVLVRRSGGDLGEILSNRFVHEDLENALS